LASIIYHETMHNLLSTEYANLHAARNIVIGEISARLGFYFSILYSVMISSAFLVQL
jgi:hypothetical protein